MKRPLLHSPWLLVMFALGACGPAPTEGDAAVISPRDSGRVDSNRPDTATSDASVADAATADTAAEDAAVALDGALGDGALGDGAAAEDGPGVDAAAPDATRPDSTINDTVALDSAPNYGPYNATDLPKLIQDATNNPVSTDSSINIPQDLQVHFVDVHFELSHADAHDLQVRLVPAFGTSTLLWDGDTCQTGECPTSIVKDQRVGVYNSTQGPWILRVTDRFTSQTGTLLSYYIHFVP